MGNSASSNGGKAGEWKGPFSDQVRLYMHVYMLHLHQRLLVLMLVSVQEYDCLVAKFQDVTTAVPAIPDVQAKLQVNHRIIAVNAYSCDY